MNELFAIITQGIPLSEFIVVICGIWVVGTFRPLELGGRNVKYIISAHFIKLFKVANDNPVILKFDKNEGHQS